MNNQTDHNANDPEVIELDSDTQKHEGYGDGSIYPYSMPKEVDIREDKYSVFDWMRKLKQEILIIDPEFQRNLVWKPEQKSKFIESILLNIPLPPIYVNQNKEGKYIIVDGLQRTTTLYEFLNNEFKLKKLEVLVDLNGYTFEELYPRLQTDIENRQLFLYIIKPSVPIAMVYDIFNRINTGGTQLNRQEIRNCIFLGDATRLLNELSKNAYFRQAIDNGISARRMKDREAILRYLAFRHFDYETLYKNDMDAFLGHALKSMNKMDEADFDKMRHDFERVIRQTHNFFGENNFRLPTEHSRGRINMALLESVSYFFAKQSDEFLETHREKILANYKHLLNNPDFIDAIRFSTGDTKRVLRRFRLAQEVLGDVYAN
ncbi:MAG: hypothetical protein B6242_16285 [Anaerolineaceae bacterium 4572_78]|nr:MAG: hypothetical protein B6242_16285 [Anaerolineaceae bacterium 4572_78]